VKRQRAIGFGKSSQIDIALGGQFIKAQ